MSKNTSKLEQLLLEASSFTQKVEKQAKLNEEAVLQTAVKEEVRKFINEATEEADEDMDFDETTTDTETPETDFGSDVEGTEDTTELGGDGDEMSFDTDEESLGDDEMSNDMSDESDEMPLDVSMGMEDNGEQVLDMSNLTWDEIGSKIGELGLQDGDEITVTYKPTFQLKTQGATNAAFPSTLDAEDDDDTEMEFDLDDESEESGDMEGNEGFEGEESDDFGSESEEEGEDEGEESEESEEDEESMEENFKYSTVNVSKGGKDAPFATKAKKGVVTETDKMIDECQDESVYEEVVKENRQIKNHLKKMALEIKGYKAREAKAEKFIKESMDKLKSLALTNTNLAYFVRLVNEHSTTHKEKMSMLQKFDAAKTTRESEITFNMLKESLSKRPLVKTPISKELVKESKENANKKATIKEEKAYISPEQKRMMELFEYKSKS